MHRGLCDDSVSGARARPRKARAIDALQSVLLAHPEPRRYRSDPDRRVHFTAANRLRCRAVGDSPVSGLQSFERDLGEYREHPSPPRLYLGRFFGFQGKCRTAVGPKESAVTTSSVRPSARNSYGLSTPRLLNGKTVGDGPLSG